MTSFVEPAKAQAAAPRNSTSKFILWSILAAMAAWVFLSNEIALLIDYPLFHSYRLQVIDDRWLLIPHALCGVIAFTIGPFQFSTRLRQKNLRRHRLLGKIYVTTVYGAALTAIAMSWPRALLPGTATQAGVWILVTTLAWVLARNGHIAVHRQWMARSYAVTFTFVSLRVLSVVPAYWNLPDSANVPIIIGTTLASILVADVIMHWREIAARRA